MDYDSIHDLNEEARKEQEDYLYCSCCLKELTPCEKLDPAKYKGEVFCDHCASDVVYLEREHFMTIQD